MIRNRRPLDQAETIDLVGKNAQGDEVTLYLVATCPWDKHGKAAQKLHDKLKAYVHFISSGQIFEDFPDVRGKRLRIEIDSEYPFGELEMQLIELVREHWCEPEAIRLTHRARRSD